MNRYTFSDEIETSYLFFSIHAQSKHSNFLYNPFMAAQTLELSSQSLLANDDDNILCSSEITTLPQSELLSAALVPPNGHPTGEARIVRAGSVEDDRHPHGR
ncbi:hypothetical protein C2S52_008368 [Perilla frutescens var. hirtella]|nr:hypothetical protein C2S52_008368 [Perilla frutescens var. hirtella]